MKLLYIFHNLALTSAAIDIQLSQTDQYGHGSKIACTNSMPNIEAQEMRVAMRLVGQDTAREPNMRATHDIEEHVRQVPNARATAGNGDGSVRQVSNMRATV